MKTSLAAAALPALFLLVAPLAAQESVTYAQATPQLKQGIVDKLPQPQYPAALKDKEPRPSGNVGLRVYVGTSGALDNVKLVKPSGNKDLDQHAQDFARKSFKFSPYKVGDKPTAWMFDWTARYKAPAGAAAPKPAANDKPAYTPPSSSAAGAPPPAYGSGRR